MHICMHQYRKATQDSHTHMCVYIYSLYMCVCIYLYMYMYVCAPLVCSAPEDLKQAFKSH